jgi:hypothetical protein
MGRMELKGRGACFVAPSHAAQIRVALERIGAGQALIAVVPEIDDLRVALGCEDFEETIGAGRLWFVSGEHWADALATLLREQDGLPTPSQFVRTSLADVETSEAVMPAADAIIRRENARRHEVIRSIHAGPEPIRDAALAVVWSHFRLWDDTGEALGGVARGAGWRVLDVAEPCSASAVALAQAAAGCGAVVVANAGRAELRAALAPGAEVLSWLTVPRIPAFDSRFGDDGLILADEAWRELAARAGWPADRTRVATWPAWDSPAGASGRGLALIADTVPVAAPEFEFSSHRLLWDTILDQISADPFCVGFDAMAYLSRWCAKTGIELETVNTRLFVERLIVPAYQQGLAGLLAGAGIELRLWGRGWGRIDGLAGRHAGEIRDRAELRAAVAEAAALVHAWPAAWAHPIVATGKSVLRAASSKGEWLREARRFASGGTARGRSGGDAAPLGASVIESLIRQGARRAP